MIDLHTHILPAIDDGAASLDISLAMARMAVADGITTVAATPHSPESIMGERYTALLVQERIEELRAALEREQIPLEVIRGTELYLAGDLVPRLRSGALFGYENSHAVLLECAGRHFLEQVPNALFALQAAGYRVLLAHPERLREVQRDPAVLAPLVERGALMQLTAETLLGQQGDVMERTAETLLRQGLIHVLASDAHGVPPRRPMILADAHARAVALVGQAAADAMVFDTPDALVHDRPLRIPPPQFSSEPKKWWQW